MMHRTYPQISEANMASSPSLLTCVSSLHPNILTFKFAEPIYPPVKSGECIFENMDSNLPNARAPDAGNTSNNAWGDIVVVKPSEPILVSKHITPSDPILAYTDSQQIKPSPTPGNPESAFSVKSNSR
ncbi:hypothetical protein HYFRA_00005540 [Hymenoscyphus fraxineus]|uniref:Uncharacterized protein n=1 Tax=Hymenoscyphus fraxineus TaxID=746836 RepID=A0A9N9PGH8_9HELO|nr:hypothetical protein HYFRA_00005540 [Hymenoscyphus fraxineus]